MQVLLRGKARAIYPLINKRWPSNAKYCNIQTYLVSCFWCISTVVFKTCRYLRTKFFRAQGSIRVNILFHFRMSHNGSFAARGKKSLPSILRARMKYCYSVSMIKVRTMVCRAFHCLSFLYSGIPIDMTTNYKGPKKKIIISWLEVCNEINTRNTPYCSLINSRSVEIVTDNNWKTLFKICHKCILSVVYIILHFLSIVIF